MNIVWDGPNLGEEERDPDEPFIAWTPCPDCGEPLCNGDCAESLGRNTEATSSESNEQTGTTMKGTP